MGNKTTEGRMSPQERGAPLNYDPSDPDKMRLPVGVTCGDCAPDADPVVGHKTMRRGDGSTYHVPLCQNEATELWGHIEVEDTRRKELMPTEESARKLFFDAYQRLKEFGWNDAVYCPKDGSTFDAIEPGSTGVHSCHYDGEWPKGSWWVFADNDVWPSRPALWRATKKEEDANGSD